MDRTARRSRPRLLTPVFGLVTVSTLLYFVAIGTLLPVLPRYVRGPLGGGNVAVGIAIGAFSISAVVLRPFAGRIGDRHGRRVLMLGGAAVMAVSIALYHVVHSLPMLVGLRLVNGIGEALFFTGAASAVNDLAPDERRGEAVSFFSLALYGGLAFGPLLGESVLRGAHFAVVWTTAAVMAAGAAIVAAGLTETRPPRDPAHVASGVILHRAAIRPGIVLAASQWGYSAMSAFMALYALQLGLHGSKFVFLTYALTILVIRGLGARIPDVLGPARTATISLVVSMTGLMLIGLAHSAGPLFAGTIVFAGGQALAFPALMSLAVSAAPAAERGAVIGTFTAFFDISYALGPISLGAVAVFFDYRGAFFGAAVVHVAGLLILLSQRRSAR